MFFGKERLAQVEEEVMKAAGENGPGTPGVRGDESPAPAGDDYFTSIVRVLIDVAMGDEART